MLTLSKKNDDIIVPPSTSSSSSSGKTSIIGPGMLIKGDLTTENDIRIDGKVVGNINSTSKVVVGESGSVEGNIEAVHADITGKITGNLTIKELLTLRQHANINGEVLTTKMSMEPSVVFNGKCSMNATISSSVVSMRKETNERKTAAGE